MRSALPVGAMVLCALMLVGCSAAAPSPAAGGPGAESSGTFTGPWADLFASTYAEVTSEDERRALDDSEISAEEYAYFQDAIVGCLARLGVSGHFNPDGSLDYDNGKGVSQDDIRECNIANGIRIIALHDAIARNPTHRDESEIMLECLHRAGVVGAGYTIADLENGIDIDALGTDPGFAGCASDPLGFEVD